MNAITRYTNSMSKTQLGLLVVFAVAAVAMLFAGFHAAAVSTVLLANPALAGLDELARELKTQTSAFEQTHGKIKEGHEALMSKYESGEKVTKETKATLDELLVNFKAQSDTVRELEQKLAQGLKDADTGEEKSWGQQFIENAAFKSFTGEGKVKVEIEKKVVNSAAAGVGLIRSYRELGITGLLQERRVMRDLLPTVKIATSSVDYARQTTRTNNAAPVAEAAAKPYSDYAWDQVSVVVRVLAHLAKVTRQAMDDAPRLMGELDLEMRYGLGYLEERQFLYGSGVGQNLTGIMPLATAFARPAGFGQHLGSTKVDVLRVAMLQNSIALLPADGIVLNEIDWADIELTKTTDGAYLFSNPQGSVDARMWSLPVVATPAMTAGDFLVGAFKQGATIYDRMAVELLISTENADDFEKNLATVRAEERVALAVKRPLAFTKGTFTTAIAALVAA